MLKNLPGITHTYDITLSVTNIKYSLYIFCIVFSVIAGIRSIEDYNMIRPHYALNGLTPMEAYTQKLPDMDFVSLPINRTV